MRQADIESGGWSGNINLLEEDQNYWKIIVQEYDDTVVFGAKISSLIASAAKVLWEEPESFEAKNGTG